MTCWARFRCNAGRTGFGVFDGAYLAPYEGDVFGAPRPTGALLERGAFALLSPCLPSRIIAPWNNFHALAAKLDEVRIEGIGSLSNALAPG